MRGTVTCKGDGQNRARDIQCNQNLNERDLWHDPEQDGPGRYWNTPSRQDCGVKYQIIEDSACKAIPLQAWTDPEGSRRMRLPDFKTIYT